MFRQIGPNVSRRRMLAGALAAVAPLAAPAIAQQIAVRFSLNFRNEASNAAFFLAEERGYFRAENLSVQLDMAQGSGEAATRIGSGAYDMAFVDINVLTEFNARNPERGGLATFVVYNRAPMSIMTLRNRNITTPRDLHGRSLGAPAGDGAFRMFPAFARGAGVDINQIRVLTIDTRLREPMLLRGEADAIVGFDLSMWFNVKTAGIRLEDIMFFNYGDYGVDVYGNSVAASKTFIQRSPEVVRAVTRAAAKAWRDTLDEPDAAIAALVSRDRLLDRALERERLDWLVDKYIRTPRTAEEGIGRPSPERLERGLGQVSEAFGLPRRVTPGEVYTDAFMPALEDRRPRRSA